MEWLKDLSVLADIPLTILLIAAVWALWKENRRLGDKMIEIATSNLHVSSDNRARLKRVEKTTTGEIAPTIAKREDLT